MVECVEKKEGHECFKSPMPTLDNMSCVLIYAILIIVPFVVVDVQGN